MYIWYIGLLGGRYGVFEIKKVHVGWRVLSKGEL